MNRGFLVLGAATWLAFLSGCGQDPIQWTAPTPLPPQLSGASSLTFGASQTLAPRAPVGGRVPASPAQCPGSVRVARDGDADWYAAWWSVRDDSTADLMVAHSRDGAMWQSAMRVDTTDVARVGCERPPPSIAADGANVHVAYAMTAREGPGIFASHSMDRGMLFHSPVAVVYGARIGLTAIAARGDRVAVAYEDPNSDPRRIGLALSRTQGHRFDSREIVSPPTGEARSPGVALSGFRIAVTWTRGVGADSTREFRLGEIR